MIMPPQKARPRGSQPQPSDYETDAPAVDVPPPPPRSNEELNLSVLRRHYPDVTALRHLAPYAVLYAFNLDTQQWEKIGIEGTLFVCELAPSGGADRFSVVILNRRGLDNFAMELTSEAEMEITDEYVILQGDQVYGLWIFSEPPPSSTANTRIETAEKIKVLAIQAAESRRAREQVVRNGADAAAEHEQTHDGSVPMGRQVSLRELFGQQRAQDSAWSVHNHHSPSPGPGGVPGVGAGPAHVDVLGQLFLKAKQDYNGVG
ncbi:PH domain-like protein [Melanomma pulvis-pyrius CBS 109.77]|uniref:PH domain-like protein n=1 Tax=Melanomma pulvis-pyrius CBS 109.77 TaxID=1314802 RepID=A0A6A6X991_9PLEO|nr:PH domain-like protein [Melanomma pulvis-pyrius CBS 109.77]